MIVAYDATLRLGAASSACSPNILCKFYDQARQIARSALLDGLAREAARGIRNIPLPGPTSQKRSAN